MVGETHEGAAELAAFVMTYDRPETLRDTLRSLLAQTSAPARLLVVDNGAQASTRAVSEAFAGRGVEYHSLPGNPGPAGAAAYALERLLEEPWEWIYWGDDDDPPEDPGQIARLLEIARHDGGEDVGGIAASGVRFDWRRGEIRRIADRDLGGPVEVDAVPGCCQLVLRRRAVASTGLPDPRLFWGWEDLEYCLRLRRAGFRLLADGEDMLKQRRRAQRLDLKPPRLPIPRETRQALPRLYYTTRNYVFLMRETFERPDLARREVMKMAAKSAFAWARGPGYALAFSRWQLRALRDAGAGRMGRTWPLSESKEPRAPKVETPRPEAAS